MATITTAVHLDDAARTAGEAMTINSGGSLTIRTDTRVHANAPASMTGSLGSVTINEGSCILDARAVRWLAYDTGTGNVPAIGTTVSQGAVSGYLLGVWADLLSAPAAAAAAMPASGFLKFREVTGGTFSAGALTGIGASATGADVTGWIEVVHDQAANLTIPRLGLYQTRGDWFYLDDTTGARGQVLQTPVNGGGANTLVPGVWIESTPGSGTYDRWPALYGSTNGWAVSHLGQAEGDTDVRQKFCKMLTNGQLQLGELVTRTSTYASVAAQASTYATVADTGTYTWADDLVTVTVSAGHFLYDGQSTGLDFTSGGATTNDGTYTATVLDPYTFTVPLAGSGTGGNVTSRPGIAVTFTAHGLNIGEQVYLTVSTGTAASGTYTIYAVPSANAYRVSYPHTAALTSGNASALHTLTVTTAAAHGQAIGNTVYLDFTSGAGVDGTYTIRTVPSTTTYTVNFPHSAVISTSNVTERIDVGYVPPSGCKTRIPNIITRQVATGARATNVVPNATLATRPEFTTTAAGAIDIEYLYDTGWYQTFAQPFSVKLHHSTTMDTLAISECATALDIDDYFIGMYGALDARCLQLTSNFAGGTIQNAKFLRGNTPGTTDHNVEVLTCIGQTFSHVEFGILQFVRSTGYPISLAQSNNITLSNCRVFNGNVRVTTCNGVTVNDLDYCDRLIGHTNATSAMYAVVFESKSNNVILDGVTFGYGGAVADCHPSSGIAYIAASDNIKIRNAGTYASPLQGGVWNPNAFALATPFVSGGNCTNVKVQRLYLDHVRTGAITTVNSDKGETFETVCVKDSYQWATKAVFNPVIAALNCEAKGLYGVNTTSGQTSVYGSHFHDVFMGPGFGRYMLAMNEPTAETESKFTMVSGVEKFNSAGGILMGTIGDQAIWEDPYFRLGHTAFVNATPTMSGGTITNYTLEYQIDTGTGWNGSWTAMTGANLAAETINPAIGFKMKIRITTISTNTTAITFLRLNTTSTAAAQQNLYPLDQIQATLTLTGLQTGSEIRIFRESDGQEIAGAENSGTSYQYTYNWEQDQNVTIVIHHLAYEYISIPGYTLTANNASIPIQQRFDRNFANPA